MNSGAISLKDLSRFVPFIEKLKESTEPEERRDVTLFKLCGRGEEVGIVGDEVIASLGGAKIVSKTNFTGAWFKRFKMHIPDPVEEEIDSTTVVEILTHVKFHEDENLAEKIGNVGGEVGDVVTTNDYLCVVFRRLVLLFGDYGFELPTPDNGNITKAFQLPGKNGVFFEIINRRGAVDESSRQETTFWHLMHPLTELQRVENLNVSEMYDDVQVDVLYVDNSFPLMVGLHETRKVYIFSEMLFFHHESEGLGTDHGNLDLSSLLNLSTKKEEGKLEDDSAGVNLKEMAGRLFEVKVPTSCGMRVLFHLDQNKKLSGSEMVVKKVDCTHYDSRDDFIIYVLCESDDSLHVFYNSHLQNSRVIPNVLDICRCSDHTVFHRRLLAALMKDSSVRILHGDITMFHLHFPELPRKMKALKCGSDEKVAFYGITDPDEESMEEAGENIFLVDVQAKLYPKTKVLVDMFECLGKVIPDNVHGGIVRDFCACAQFYREKFESQKNFPSEMAVLIEVVLEIVSKNDETKKLPVITPRVLFMETCPEILFILHLLYESYKLRSLTHSLLEPLAQLLHLLAKLMRFEAYSDHYERDFAKLGKREIAPTFCEEGFEKWTYEGEDIAFTEAYSSETPPDIQRYILNLLRRKYNMSYPVVRDSSGPLDLCRKICRIYHVLVFDKDVYCRVGSRQLSRAVNEGFERVLFVLIDENLTEFEYIDTLPFFVSTYVKQVAFSVRKKCSQSFGGGIEATEEFGDAYLSRAYEFIERGDLKKLALLEESSRKRSPHHHLGSRERLSEVKNKKWIYYDFDDSRGDVNDLFDADRYYADISRWKKPERTLGYRVFSEDRRLDSAWQFLSNTKPYQIPRNFEEDVVGFGSYHQMLLILIFSLSIGKGMLHLCTRTFSMTELLKFPALTITAVIPQERGVQKLNLQDFLPDNQTEKASIKKWPRFHLSVSQTLQMCRARGNIVGDSHTQYVTREWVTFHRTEKPTLRHAGFLLALGMLQHLDVLDRSDIYSYLADQHELTTMALILGLSVSRMGTQDSITSRLLTMHIMELESGEMEKIPREVQATSLLGLGYVYLQSSHRYFSELLLTEIARVPKDGCKITDAYTLSAGMGFGLVNLARGTEDSPPSTLKGINIDDLLFRLLKGGKYPPQLRGMVPERMVRDSQYYLQPDQTINHFVTGPAANMALMLMYLMSNNKTIADRLSPPQTRYELKSLFPDIMCQRVLAKNMVMWDDIKPTVDWILSNSPKPCVELVRDPSKTNSQRWYKCYWMVIQHFYALAGACFSIGLKFAGSGREDILDTLGRVYAQIRMALKIEPCEKLSFDFCCVVVVVSMSMVMAGRGHISIVRYCREIRSVQAGNFSIQFPLSMALGLSFLGAGRLTLSTSPLAVANMIISLFPKFPSTIVDNKFHLQLYRHLYVLAAEPRVLEAIDVDTNLPCFVPVLIHSGLKRGHGKEKRSGVYMRKFGAAKLSAMDRTALEVLLGRKLNLSESQSGVLMDLDPIEPPVLNTIQNQDGKSSSSLMDMSEDGLSFAEVERDINVVTKKIILPALIPEKKQIKSIEVVSPRYYPLKLTRKKGHLDGALENLVLYVKKVAQFSSTISREDAISAKQNQNLTTCNVQGRPENLKYFRNSSNHHIYMVDKHLFQERSGEKGMFHKDQLLYQSLLKDTNELIIDQLQVEEALFHAFENPTNVLGIKILDTLYSEFLFPLRKQLGRNDLCILSPKFVQKVRMNVEQKLQSGAIGAEEYVLSNKIRTNIVGSFLKYYQIPQDVKQRMMRVKKNMGEYNIAVPLLMSEFPELNYETVIKLQEMLLK